MLTVDSEDIRTVADQFVANPARGEVELSADEDGRLIAEWTMADGKTASVGPAITKPLP